MHIALSVQFGRDDQLIFAQQLGVEHVIARVESWDEKTLASLKNRVEKTGLKLAALEGLAVDDTEQVIAAVRAAGALGIELISCAVGPLHLGRQRLPTGRGGALIVSTTPIALVVTRDADAIFAAAKDADVSIAWSGKSAPDNGGIDLPLGSLGDDPTATIAALEAPILIARATNSLGATQAFLDEGDSSIPKILLALKQSGFNGPLCAATPPGLNRDSDWGHKGRAFDLGYLKAILQAINTR